MPDVPAPHAMEAMTQYAVYVNGSWAIEHVDYTARDDGLVFHERIRPNSVVHIFMYRGDIPVLRAMCDCRLPVEAGSYFHPTTVYLRWPDENATLWPRP